MVLNVYKPKGWTSFDVVAKLRGILKERKVGHAGTLDPLAEGVLIVLVGADTKRQDEFMHQTKEYLAEIAFGIESPTFDMEGPLTFHDDALSKEKVLGMIPNFVGTYKQIVPAYSAKKVAGKKLYDIYRNEKYNPKDLPRKTVTINSIEVISLDGKVVQGHPVLVLKCAVNCGSGTYIRSLAYEMGRKLGTYATLYSLVRTRAGDFKVEDAKTLESLAEQF